MAYSNSSPKWLPRFRWQRWGSRGAGCDRSAEFVKLSGSNVVAGVIGTKKFIYDLWGDTVNIASRMESHGTPGSIQITDSTFQQVKDQFQIEALGKIEVKGKGEMLTYRVLKTL